MQNMHVNNIFMASAGNGSGWFPGPAAGSVDAGDVFFQPRTDLFQNRNRARLDAAIRHQADIQRQIAVAARALRKNPDDFSRRFDPVIQFPGPIACPGSCRFPTGSCRRRVAVFHFSVGRARRCPFVKE
jgi:hypothetical protein